jgi:hypothetical protein
MDINLMATLFGATIALAGVFLQSILAYKFSIKQSLLDAKRVIFSRLLSAVESEDSCPNFNPNIHKVEDFNRKIDLWRENRRKIKGIAAEALLVSENEELKTLLRDLIKNFDPERKFKDVEDLMRKEIQL